MIVLGLEKLRCPRCRRVTVVEVHSDLPERDWLTCSFCGFKGLMDFRPVLSKYGLLHGMSKQERRDFSKHLKRDVNKL